MSDLIQTGKLAVQFRGGFIVSFRGLGQFLKISKVPGLTISANGRLPPPTSGVKGDSFESRSIIPKYTLVMLILFTGRGA
jgi:hypothetical protein